LPGRFAAGVLGSFVLIAALPVRSAAPPDDSRRAQDVSLRQVLARARQYVTTFHQQLAGIVAEETYLQEVHRVPSAGRVVPVTKRSLRSDLLLVRRPGEDRYVEFRDVFAVNGAQVRDREERLTALFLDPTPADTQRLKSIINESARYNAGALIRNINTPLLALSFLEPALQPRFRFERARPDRPVLATPSHREAADGAMFRISSEMWTIEFREATRPSLIKTTEGRDFPARGRLWIDPATGTVLMSELILKNSRIDAVIAVSYQSEPLLGFLVPVEMRERYRSRSERVEGVATYGRFRQFQVKTEQVIGKPPGG
jgi:hypothetical protein